MKNNNEARLYFDLSFLLKRLVNKKIGKSNVASNDCSSDYSIILFCIQNALQQQKTVACGVVDEFNTAKKTQSIKLHHSHSIDTNSASDGSLVSFDIMRLNTHTGSHKAVAKFNYKFTLLLLSAIK
jgi:hypothetical protein